ncbi:MAG TPA: serine/threonine-protein kinase, partial [Candidatus Eisenbacteria bacterium]|nr:serine/threonine-protein kinase [Candidatus Eisenbacteria bacterium]
MIGRTLSRYRVLERLGGGGMGEVYRAHDERLDRDVALKILAPGRGTAEDRDRIRREARVLSRLSHPGISTVFDVESAEDVEFLVLELVRGETLQERLRRGPLPEATALEWAAQIADALEAAHQRGVIHRDLKPANVMVTREGRVKVLDFGLAKPARPGSPLEGAQAPTMESPLSAAGQVVGTVPYMAPEQVRGEAVDARTDL